MNLKKADIISKLIPVKNTFIRYAVVIFIIFVVGILSFMTLRIAHYANLEPNAQQIDDKKTSLKVVKLDETAVKKVKELQDKNITIESLFDNGRINPFE